jgi:uncharacterized OsmC-like protein
MERALEEKTVNGVHVMDLQATIEAVRHNPALGQSRFQIKNRWMGRALNRTTIGDFYVAGQMRKHKTALILDNDEAEVLLGEDRAANPVEYLLHALAGCVTTTTVYHAAARGIHIRTIETEIEGELDVQGLLQTNPQVRTGFQNIRIKMKIDSDAEGEKLEELKRLYQFSPVLGTLTRPAQIQFQVETK